MAAATDENDQTFSKGRNGGELQDDEKTPLLERNADSGRNLQKTTTTEVQVALCLVILVTELCERLAFYSIFTNFVPYCEHFLKLPTPVPSQINLLFSGCCTFLPILGGWIADTYLGRFNTIYGSSLIYFVGCSLVTFATYNYDVHGLAMSLSSREVFLAISLALIGLGTGGIKANVSPFGADQIRSAGEAAVTRFFNWFYWFINVGGMVATTVVAYVQQEIAFFYGYLIAAVSILLASLIFLAGRKYYRTEPPEGSAMSRTIKIVWHGLKTKCRRSKTHEDGTWLDQTKNSKGGRFSNSEVEEVKKLIPIFPIFLTFIVFGVVYNQMGTTFIRQGIHMKLKLGSFDIPAASLGLFDTLVIIVFIPILDKAVYPLLTYWGVKITSLRKIGVGMIISAASMAVAGVIEIERKNLIEKYGIFYQTPFNTPTNASTMVVLYQAPQYFLVGSSEVLIFVTGLEFAYSQSAKNLRGVVTGLFLAMGGIGTYVAAALVSIVRSLATDWYPENLNTGSLEKYFFLLMGIMLLNFVVYLSIAVRYKYVSSENDSLEDKFNETKASDSRKESKSV